MWMESKLTSKNKISITEKLKNWKKRKEKREKRKEKREKRKENWYSGNYQKNKIKSYN